MKITKLLVVLVLNPKNRLCVEYSVKDIRRALSTVFVSDACLSLSFPNRWHKHSSFAYEFTVFSNILNCMYSESLNQ